jgi:KUP system potassium uptake protein
VLLAVSPHYALEFLTHNGRHAFFTLGSVFLAVTGGEALYADMGHFGRQPIRITWFSVVLPALLLNYLGQGAYMLRAPQDAEHPFFNMAPAWALYPLVGLAAAAAVIASQAVITGAFSLTLQAIQLGYAPRLTIRHTSSHKIGQIYIPVINWLLMVACIGIVLGFGTSTNLAAAYGVAITMTMVITTILFYTLVRTRWHWNWAIAVAVSGFFFVVDAAFFGANIIKIEYGGWFPLFVAALVFLVLSTWRRGREILAKRLRHRLIPLELFLADLLVNPPMRVPGMAVFMFGNPIGTPPALRHNVVHNKVLHDTVVILGVETAEIPHVCEADRFFIEEIGEGFWRVIVRYGFMEEPDLPETLATVKHPQLDFTRNDLSYFLGRETLISTPKPGMARWRERLFVWLSRNAQTATDFFNLPPERVVEVGVQVEL